MNSLFGLFHCDGQQVNSCGEPSHHVFGAVITPMKAGGYDIKGLDFTGDQGIPMFDMPRVGERKADSAVIFPITPQQKQRFIALVTTMNRLHQAGRLPFYYTLNSLYDPYEEVRGKAPIDLWGNSKEIHRGDNPDNFQIRVNPLDHTDFDERCNTQGLVRASANCITLLQFACKVSGIDLEAIDNQIDKRIRGKAIYEALGRLHESADGCALEYDYPDDPRKLFVKQGGGANGHSFVFRTESWEDIKIRHFLVALEKMLGPKSSIRNFLNNIDPHEMPPAPLPFYIQQEIDKAGIDFNALVKEEPADP